MNLSYFISFNIPPVICFSFYIHIDFKLGSFIYCCLNKTKNLKVIWQMMKNRNSFYLMVHLLLANLGAAFQIVGDTFLT